MQEWRLLSTGKWSVCLAQRKAWISSPALHKLGVVLVHTCNSSTWAVEAGISSFKVQGHLWQSIPAQTT